MRMHSCNNESNCPASSHQRKRFLYVHLLAFHILNIIRTETEGYKIKTKTCQKCELKRPGKTMSHNKATVQKMRSSPGSGKILGSRTDNGMILLQLVDCLVF